MAKPASRGPDIRLIEAPPSRPIYRSFDSGENINPISAVLETDHLENIEASVDSFMNFINNPRILQAVESKLSEPSDSTDSTKALKTVTLAFKDVINDVLYKHDESMGFKQTQKIATVSQYYKEALDIVMAHPSVIKLFD